MKKKKGISFHCQEGRIGESQRSTYIKTAPTVRVCVRAPLKTLCGKNRNVLKDGNNGQESDCSLAETKPELLSVC